jgi:hypothetical protein
VTFKGLIRAWKKTHNKLLSGEWERKHAMAFLSVETVNKKAIEALIENAMNCKQFFVCEKNNHKYLNEYQSMFYQKQTFQLNYQILQYPVLWNRGNDLDIHIDVPMHLLFLGITKTVVRMIQAWCALGGCTTTFTKHANSTLQSLDDLGLSWMVCVPYTGAKLGGWISENYLALERLNCWFYSMLSTVITEYQFIETQTPEQYWTMKQNLGWLKVCDLSRGAAKMNAKDLSQLVHDYMKQVGGPPPMKQGIGGNVVNIKVMLESLSTMMDACMQSEYTGQDILLLDLKIKVFLSDSANFDNSMKCCSDVVDIGTSSGPNFTEPNEYNEDGPVIHAVCSDDEDDDDEEDDDAKRGKTTGVLGTKKKKKKQKTKKNYVLQFHMPHKPT